MNDRDNGPAYWWVLLASARHTPYSTDGAHHGLEKVVLPGRELLNEIEMEKAMEVSRKEVQISMIFNEQQQLFKYPKKNRKHKEV